MFDPVFPVPGSPCITGRAFGMVGLPDRATFAQRVAPGKAKKAMQNANTARHSDFFAVIRSRVLRFFAARAPSEQSA